MSDFELQPINHKKYTRKQNYLKYLYDKLLLFLNENVKKNNITFKILRNEDNEEDLGNYKTIIESGNKLTLVFDYGMIVIKIIRGEEIKSKIKNIFEKPDLSVSRSAILPNFNIFEDSLVMITTLDDLVVGNNYLIKCRNPKLIVDYIATCIEKTNVATFNIIYHRIPRREPDVYNDWTGEPDGRIIVFDPLSNNGCNFFMLPEYGNMISATNTPMQVTQTVERNIKKDATSTIKNISKKSSIPPEIGSYITGFLGGKRKLKISRGVKGSQGKRKTKKLK